ncbi:MAG: hypothetical protein TECD_00583 [Hyphomicrobiaceae bacterium hypho_1]
MSISRDIRTTAPHTTGIRSNFNAVTCLEKVATAARHVAYKGGAKQFDISDLSLLDLAWLAEILGEGEVSVKINETPQIIAQESVFAGIWHLKSKGVDKIEVAAIPELALTCAFKAKSPGQKNKTPLIKGLLSAPALLTEILDKSANYRLYQTPYVINLTHLPHTESDLQWLDKALGTGMVTILSRGYGNCRISATATYGVWRVQFFNSTDTLVLDTFEITNIPKLALASAEDISDSSLRIVKALETIA